MADAGATMNAERKAAGRKALIRDARLDKAAQSHACWMAETDTFSHKGAGGSLPKRRITATGYRPMLTAENIAFGQSSGARVIAEWMESSGHRENILRRGVVEYGVGVALMQGRPVWVMVYADK
ncbi:CAP domain-containing protein [Maritimibacter sp. HL-12]|uniref:CAP domain-containing protein n=1 Tax=Maritimibacter sp. HL-12 TaxID=1162418 RepID=UPI00111C1F7C|nr:CAP domain-containing protein [Maritimibacter sp. HL-12]